MGQFEGDLPSREVGTFDDPPLPPVTPVGRDHVTHGKELFSGNLRIPLLD